MRVVTAHTALEAHGRMLEGKRAPFVGVTFGASRLVASSHIHLPWIQASVGRMAIHATDRPLLQTVSERLGEGGLNILVAAETELI